ncbi:D-alanyl-D-alanine carboxypeptidase/D-alanyl-D-alanine-endopeptidase [Hymenobacter cellulosivorans]|uniref:D-alanyl-D-alanine carboxypeptidase n=1 Tax=Hymenobacter cellulosivorans TaxID=2932249 RepID=A0ABY4F822_9BACT|nr:D-alanyl-D-alanine carboxypeptidase [Hymenobacter cellulosivorans]UOQ52710.1 D-alanyl-D-alanine carboxypeptidase [Hymenobacter cellulosivorans]
MSCRLLLVIFLLCAGLLPKARAQSRADDNVGETALRRGKGPRWLNRLLTGSAVLSPHHVGLSIIDVTTGEPVYELNGAEYFQPASTMKLFSLYAGLHLLGDSLPSLRYVVHSDSLIFWGTGDPTLLHGDVPSRRAFAFLQSRPEKLFYTTIPSVEAFGPGWSWDDYNYYFQPERSPFPLYGNTVRFRAAPNQALRVAPRSFAALVEPAPPGTTSPDHVRRPLLENRFVVYPSARSWTDETPFRTDSELVVKLLQDTLRRPVLALPWRPWPQESIRTVQGVAVDSLYRRMLQVSDNFLAEQLLLLCSSRLGADSLSTARVIRTMHRQFLADLPDAPRWVDGSGLSRLNLATPRDLTALLLKLHQQVPEPRLLSLLAAGGGHGSLRRGYHDARGTWFWGKTGTLTNVHNLSGYLRTHKGRLLAVSFMNNNHVAETSAVRREMERILAQVRERL